MTGERRGSFTDWFMPIACFAPLGVLLVFLVVGRIVEGN